MPSALITGAAKRVGKSIALKLAKEGYDIALHYNASESEAKATAQEIEALGRVCKCYQADLTGEATARTLLSSVQKDFPELTLLVNNASIFEKRSFLETDEAFLDAQMRVNFYAPFFLTQAFAKTYNAGHVVNLLDTYVSKDTPAYFAYLLAKKTLFSFTRMAARDLAPNVQVNAIAPGTTGNSKGVDVAYLARKKEQLPQGELTTFDDIAHAVLQLTQNPTITGNCLFLDSGEQLI